MFIYTNVDGKVIGCVIKCHNFLRVMQLLIYAPISTAVQPNISAHFYSQRPVTRSFDFSLISAWINGWVNNRQAGDLRRHHAHYDVIVMGPLHYSKNPSMTTTTHIIAIIHLIDCAHFAFKYTSRPPPSRRQSSEYKSMSLLFHQSSIGISLKDWVINTSLERKSHHMMTSSNLWKHFQRYWPFVRGIHRSPVNSPHKGQWRGALMFSLICTRSNG